MPWGTEIARQLIEATVSEQADDGPEAELGECPVCGKPARKAPDEPRVLFDHREARSPGRNALATAPAVCGLFFPQG